MPFFCCTPRHICQNEPLVCNAHVSQKRGFEEEGQKQATVIACCDWRGWTSGSSSFCVGAAAEVTSWILSNYHVKTASKVEHALADNPASSCIALWSILFLNCILHYVTLLDFGHGTRTWLVLGRVVLSWVSKHELSRVMLRFPLRLVWLARRIWSMKTLHSLGQRTREKKTVEQIHADDSNWDSNCSLCTEHLELCAGVFSIPPSAEPLFIPSGCLKLSWGPSWRFAKALHNNDYR